MCLKCKSTQICSISELRQPASTYPNCKSGKQSYCIFQHSITVKRIDWLFKSTKNNWSVGLFLIYCRCVPTWDTMTVSNRGKTLVYVFMQTCICVCVSGLSPAPHIPITAPSVCHTFVWWLFTAGRACAAGGDSAFDSLYAEHMWDRTWSSPAEKTWPPKVTLMFITSHQSPQLFRFNHNLNFPLVSRNICI